MSQRYVGVVMGLPHHDDITYVDMATSCDVTRTDDYYYREYMKFNTFSIFWYKENTVATIDILDVCNNR